MEYLLLEKLGTRTTAEAKSFEFWNISKDVLLVEHHWSENLKCSPKISFQVFVLVVHNLSWSGGVVLKLDCSREKDGHY